MFCLALEVLIVVLCTGYWASSGQKGGRDDIIEDIDLAYDTPLILFHYPCINIRTHSMLHAYANTLLRPLNRK